MALKKLLLARHSRSPAHPPARRRPLGTVVNVQGVVTATQGTTGMTVAPGTGHRRTACAS